MIEDLDRIKMDIDKKIDELRSCLNDLEFDYSHLLIKNDMLPFMCPSCGNDDIPGKTESEYDGSRFILYEYCSNKNCQCYRTSYFEFIESEYELNV